MTSEVLSEQARHTCDAFALQAALTLENAQMAEALEQSRYLLSVSEENLRREIEEMLYGRVQTRLLLAGHRLGQRKPLLAQDPDRAGAILEEVRHELDRIREEEIRTASHLLHPPSSASALCQSRALLRKALRVSRRSL